MRSSIPAVDSAHLTRGRCSFPSPSGPSSRSDPSRLGHWSVSASEPSPARPATLPTPAGPATLAVAHGTMAPWHGAARPDDRGGQIRTGRRRQNTSSAPNTVRRRHARNRPHQQASHMVQQMKQRLAGNPLITEWRYRDFGSLVSPGEYSTVGNLMGGLTGGRAHSTLPRASSLDEWSRTSSCAELVLHSCYTGVKHRRSNHEHDIQQSGGTSRKLVQGWSVNIRQPCRDERHRVCCRFGRDIALRSDERLHGVY